MDYTTRELLKRYAKKALGQPFAPVLLNILVTSVCDMRCTHCFFTDELDDRPRKKLQMKTDEIDRIAETLGDKIPQKPGSWQIAIETARELKAMKKQYPLLDLQTCTCFMHSNQDTIFEWYEFLKHDLKPDKVNFNYIRPPSADPIELDIDLTRYAKLAQMIDDDSRHAAIKNNYGGNAGFFKAAIDIYMHGLIAKTQETGAAQLTCYAGTAGAVIYDEGTLSSCENLAPIGNLRDHDWNFQGLWLSPAMKARRKQAADGCFCTHESNCYYPSLPFNPKHLIQIKKLEREMKKARRELEKQVEPEPEGLRARA